jgi:hypothetical protein
MYFLKLQLKKKKTVYWKNRERKWTVSSIKGNQLAG